MTTYTEPPAESFRLSMLLYDTRYRSLTIQVIALMAFMLADCLMRRDICDDVSLL